MPRFSSTNKAAGYIVRDGQVIGEMRQCSHCQFTWEYKPGSGARRGVCLKCMGLVCGKPDCMAGCAPLRAVIDGGDTGYKMNEKGIMVRV